MYLINIIFCAVATAQSPRPTLCKHMKLAEPQVDRAWRIAYSLNCSIASMSAACDIALRCTAMSKRAGSTDCPTLTALEVLEGHFICLTNAVQLTTQPYLGPDALLVPHPPDAETGQQVHASHAGFALYPHTSLINQARLAPLDGSRYLLLFVMRIRVFADAKICGQILELSMCTCAVAECSCDMFMIFRLGFGTCVLWPACISFITVISHSSV